MYFHYRTRYVEYSEMLVLVVLVPSTLVHFWWGREPIELTYLVAAARLQTSWDQVISSISSNIIIIINIAIIIFVVITFIITYFSIISSKLTEQFLNVWFYKLLMIQTIQY